MSPRIHPDAPTDSDGNPVHPDEGYPICGRTKSDKTTETDHGRERDDVPFCTLRAGWGTDYDDPGVACDHHGGSSPRGKENANYEHGGYSEHLQSDLSDREQEAFEALVGDLNDPETAVQAMQELGAEAIIRYKRSADPRFLREARQLLSEFNVVDNTDQVELEHSGEVDGALDVTVNHHRVTEEDMDESDD